MEEGKHGNRRERSRIRRGRGAGSLGALIMRFQQEVSMESIDVDKLQLDPLAAALAGTDKETVTVSGYICAVDEATLSVCTTRDGTS